MPDEPVLQLSREALLHNLRLIRRQLKPGTKICAMVKADAYGHGADAVVDVLGNFEFDQLSSPAVDMLGVGCLQEAQWLSPTNLPILILRPVENVYIGPARQAIEHAIRSGWMLTLGTCAAADDVARIAMSIGRRADIHVMIDSGMTRCGCSTDSLPELLQKIESLTSLRLMSLGSQLATSDVAGDSFVAEQSRIFHQATDPVVTARNGRIIRSLANSGGIFFAPGTHFDMVRPGISMYGIDPTCRPSADRALKPVARLVAPIVSILNVTGGASIGYGRSHTVSRDTRIGLVPVGYADGYHRSWGNRARMIVCGVAVPVVGRVSMDLATIDLHDVPKAQLNDPVTILDDDPLSPASAYQLAALSDTIPYEVLTRIGPRVKRVAVDQSARTAEAANI